MGPSRVDATATSAEPRARPGPGTWLLLVLGGLGLLVGLIALDASVVPLRTGACTVPSGYLAHFQADGVDRVVDIIVPEGADATTPMIVSLHGALFGIRGLQHQSDTREFAAATDAIAVFPEALGRNRVWDVAPGSADANFVTGLIDFLHDRNCSSTPHTYVQGFSAGAMMTSRLLCEPQPPFVGAAMVAGALPPTPGCTVAADTPIVIVHGDADDVVPIDGSLPEDLSRLLGDLSFPQSRPQMAADWARAKGCEDPSPTSVLEPGRVITTYRCPATAPTVALVYLGGRHTWQAPDGWSPSGFIWSTWQSAG